MKPLVRSCFSLAVAGSLTLAAPMPALAQAPAPSPSTGGAQQNRVSAQGGNQVNPQQQGNRVNPNAQQNRVSAQGNNQVNPQQQRNQVNPNAQQNRVNAQGNSQVNPQQQGNRVNPNVQQNRVNAQGNNQVSPQQQGNQVNSNTQENRVNTQGTNQVSPQQQPNQVNPNQNIQQPGTVQDDNLQGDNTVSGGASFQGTISDFGNSGFNFTGATGTSPRTFLTGSTTEFVDSAGRPVERSMITQDVPVTVYYTQSGNDFTATRVVARERPGAFTEGSLTEVSPGVIVVKLPGASDTPVRYVNDKTTNYVDLDGNPVPPESVTAGTAVKVFYTKVGDTLVASKVEVQRGGTNLPKPPGVEDSPSK